MHFKHNFILFFFFEKKKVGKSPGRAPPPPPPPPPNVEFSTFFLTGSLRRAWHGHRGLGHMAHHHMVTAHCQVLLFTLVMIHDIISKPKVVMSISSINTALECCRKCAVSVGGGGGAGLHVLNGNLRPPVKMTLTDGKHSNTLLCSNCPTASN